MFKQGDAEDRPPSRTGGQWRQISAVPRQLCAEAANVPSRNFLPSRSVVSHGNQTIVFHTKASPDLAFSVLRSGVSHTSMQAGPKDCCCYAAQRNGCPFHCGYSLSFGSRTVALPCQIGLCDVQTRALCRLDFHLHFSTFWMYHRPILSF